MTPKQTATTNTPPQQPLREWHENPSEQKAFLDLVNTEGFALEDVVHEMLFRCQHRLDLHPGEVFEGAAHRGGGRVEIDLWARIGGRVFLIESKRSDYDLIFLQNKESKRDIHLIIDSPENTFVTTCPFCRYRQAALKHVQDFPSGLSDA